MTSFLIRLDESELDALRAAAAAQGRSMNDLAREGLRAVTSDVAREERIRTLTRRVRSEHVGLLRSLSDA